MNMERSSEEVRKKFGRGSLDRSGLCRYYLGLVVCRRDGLNALNDPDAE
jgi:hypothetical protein